MDCPKCSHRISVMESIKIHNPFDFACPRCVTRLHIGPRGKLVLLASILGGVLAGQAITKLWVATGIVANDSLFLLLTALAMLALPWQIISLYLADVRARLPGTDRT